MMAVQNGPVYPEALECMLRFLIPRAILSANVVLAITFDPSVHFHPILPIHKQEDGIYRCYCYVITTLSCLDSSGSMNFFACLSSVDAIFGVLCNFAILLLMVVVLLKLVVRALLGY